MLELYDIKKDYPVAGGVVHALRGVSVKFRKNEFVSILGASGCGKTTLLNIIGGLDKYTSGDLLIEGVSTKKYGDRDWDTYRNHSVGFIFQSYHLIPHQTILQNVELALTISGVGKEERRRRAIEALEKVGLSDKLKSRPNQLSGGQAQRVAIARALINDPEIVLADEPTGALDSKTSVQIMELLKEISQDRLVIMVTHNPELAEKYSTRIIRLLDGEIIDDTRPYDGGEESAAKEPAAEEPAPEKTAAESNAETAENAAEQNEVQQNGGVQNAGHKTNKGSKKRTSMSMRMAFSLSLKNLLSKFKRTAMVSVAGSIGIIGVSMVLAISAGVQNYIASMENDMLSGYPLQVTETAIDFSSLMDIASSSGQKVEIEKLKDKVYVDSLLETLMNFDGAKTTNEITYDYKNYVEAMPQDYYNALQFGYAFDMSNYIYTDFKVSNDKIDSSQDVSGRYSVTGIRSMYTSVLGEVDEYKQYSYMISTVTSFREIPDNYEYILSQYDILATDLGKTENLTEDELKSIFRDKESLIMVVDDYEFSDLNFAQYGYLTEDEFLNFAYKAAGAPEFFEGKIKDIIKNGKDYGFFVGENAKTFTWYPNDTIYRTTSDGEMFSLNTNVGKQELPAKMIGAAYTYNINEASFGENKDEGKIDMKVRVMLQRKKGVNYGCLSTGLYYTKALTEHTIQSGMESEIAKYVNGNEKKSLSLLPYNYEFTYLENGKPKLKKDTALLINAGNAMSMMGGMMGGMGGSSGSNPYEVTPGMLAGNDLPVSFNIYPLDFDSKNLVTDWLDKWNDACNEGGGTLNYTNAAGETIEVGNLGEAQKITYTDAVGLIITMVNTMIQMITIALIAFTALSLVVSTVMVGIITYVSVVERVKEIGILRAVGARKKDIKRLFNAETFIIGFAAGLVGIGVTYLLSGILNLALGAAFGIHRIAALPLWQAAVMIGVSVALTLVSGLIPASAAAKKDPVVALRTE